MTAFIHQTDLFHPHGDPDDHWDLAAVYALTGSGRLDLRGVMFDYPPAHRAGDPATLAMAQLGHLFGVAGIPYAVGSMSPMRSRKDAQGDLDKSNLAAAEWLCRVLESSIERVSINIVGSCTDAALAGLLRPDLFEAKCDAIYLNAGAANPGAAGELEYNVRLNPSSYAAIFDLPCPVYWCPCWHQTEVREVGPNGTWYSFLQENVFAHLSDDLCNYFLYMLSRSVRIRSIFDICTSPWTPSLEWNSGSNTGACGVRRQSCTPGGWGWTLKRDWFKENGLTIHCLCLNPFRSLAPIMEPQHGRKPAGNPIATSFKSATKIVTPKR